MTFILAKIAFTCDFTVPSLMNKAEPISLLFALEHVVEHRCGPRPRDRRAAARLEAERRLAARGLRVLARRERAASRSSGASRPRCGVRRGSPRPSREAPWRVSPPARAGRMRRTPTPILDDPLSTDAQPASHQARAAQRPPRSPRGPSRGSLSSRRRAHLGPPRHAPARARRRSSPSASAGIRSTSRTCSRSASGRRSTSTRSTSSSCSTSRSTTRRSSG